MDEMRACATYCSLNLPINLLSRLAKPVAYQRVRKPAGFLLSIHHFLPARACAV